MTTDVARGWGILAPDGSRLAYEFHGFRSRAVDNLTYDGERVRRVVLLPLAEYRRLRRIERGVNTDAMLRKWKRERREARRGR